MVISVVLLIVCTVLGWQYYQEYKETQQLITKTQDRIYGEAVSLKRTIKPLVDMEEYSYENVKAWSDMQASAEKILQVLEIRAIINRPLEEYSTLSNMHSTFTNFLYFIKHTRRTLYLDDPVEIPSCDNAMITTDEDITKRLAEYLQLLDYIEDVEDSYTELVNGWDTQQAYQVNTCGNW